MRKMRRKLTRFLVLCLFVVGIGRGDIAVVIAAAALLLLIDMVIFHSTRICTFR